MVCVVPDHTLLTITHRADGTSAVHGGLAKVALRVSLNGQQFTGDVPFSIFHPRDQPAYHPL